MITTQYEYAGFIYHIFINNDGQVISAIPAPGQHSAAMRERNKRAAIECFKVDYRKAIK